MISPNENAPAKKPRVKDPVRYPKVINHYEGLAKSLFITTSASIIGDLVKTMVFFKK